MKKWLKNAVMSKEKIQIRYDGPDLSEHTMDVAVLGPSLTSLGELISHANYLVNGDDIRVKVKLHADIKANCVTLALDVHWESLYEQAKNLINHKDVLNAKELLEWIGIVGGGAGTLILAIKWLWNRKKNNEVVIVKRNGDKIILSVEGTKEKLELQEKMYQAALSQTLQEDLKETMKPLLQEGITEQTFISKDSSKTFEQKDAEDFRDICNDEIDPEASEQEIMGHIVIHAPVFEEGSKIWKFKWNDRVESINVSNTSIPETVLQRGRVVVGDAFKVVMIMSEKRTKRGFKQKFRIKEVLAFVPTQYEQAELIWENDDNLA